MQYFKIWPWRQYFIVDNLKRTLHAMLTTQWQCNITKVKSINQYVVVNNQKGTLHAMFIMEWHCNISKVHHASRILSYLLILCKLLLQCFAIYWDLSKFLLVMGCRNFLRTMEFTSLLKTLVGFQFCNRDKLFW